jgi:hypothetical protein
MLAEKYIVVQDLTLYYVAVWDQGPEIYKRYMTLHGQPSLDEAKQIASFLNLNAKETTKETEERD